jgi:hypothetical protein
MALTVQQLTNRLIEVMNNVSNDEHIQPSDARQALASGFAAAFNDFVTDREVAVPGTGLVAGNAAVSGIATGKIKAI